MEAEKKKLRIEVMEAGGKPVLILDEENRLIAKLKTYNPRIKPGEYEEPEEVARILIEILTHGHPPKVVSEGALDLRKFYEYARTLLLYPNIPPGDRIAALRRFLQGLARKKR